MTSSSIGVLILFGVFWPIMAMLIYPLLRAQVAQLRDGVAVGGSPKPAEGSRVARLYVFLKAAAGHGSRLPMLYGAVALMAVVSAAISQGRGLEAAVALPTAFIGLVLVSSAHVLARTARTELLVDVLLATLILGLGGMMAMSVFGEPHDILNVQSETSSAGRMLAIQSVIQVIVLASAAFATGSEFAAWLWRVSRR